MLENMEAIHAELNSHLDSRSYRQFTDLIDELHPVDVAEYVETLPDEKIVRVFRLLKKDVAAEIFAELGSAAR
jgi:magnesium transporter